VSSADIRTIQDYHTHVRQRVARSGKSDDWNAVRIIPVGRAEGAIRGELQFNDGAVLRFTENIVIDATGTIDRPIYSYQYQRVDNNISFYFRYDRDPERAKPVIHEECHLHVNEEGLRFKTHVTAFDEVFDFIVASFYAS
jgi:hypothetical protein